MSSSQRIALLVGTIIVLALVVFVVIPYMDRHQNKMSGEHMDAANVVDLEVQAQKQYEASGGTYQ